MEELMQSTTTIAETPAIPTFVVDEGGEKKNAQEFVALEASSVANATVNQPIQCNTKEPACQIAGLPTLDEIEREIAIAARARIETALRDLNETRARIVRDRSRRASALASADEHVTALQSQLNALEGDRAAMEQRAKVFLSGEALKATMSNIHLAINVRQLELEDSIAGAQANAQEIESEIEATAVTDAMELQFAEQNLGQLEAAAPDVAKQVRLAAAAAENIEAARQSAIDGRLAEARTLLGEAIAGNADSSQIAEVEQLLAEGEQEQIANDLIKRMDAVVDQNGAVRRIRKLIAEAASRGVGDRVEGHAARVLRAARKAANARFAQARPIAEHLMDEGLVPFVGDGRIEAWLEVSKNGHGPTWTLDRVLVLNEGVWNTKKPSVPITSHEPPERLKRSQWFRRRVARAGAAPA
jgi:hypothetical protein